MLFRTELVPSVKRQLAAIMPGTSGALNESQKHQFLPFLKLSTLHWFYTVLLKKKKKNKNKNKVPGWAAAVAHVRPLSRDLRPPVKYCLPLCNGIVLSNQNLLKCNQRSYTVLINIYIYINMSSCPLSTSSIPETSPTFKKYLDDPVLQQQVLQTGRKSSNKLPEWMGGPVFLQIWWLHATGSMFLDLRSRPRALRGEWNVADIRLLAMRSPWPTHLKMRLW